MVLEGLFTHFSSADSDDQSHTLNQITKFNEIVEQCKKNNIQFKWIHAANSAGIFQYASSHFNMVRPGISLYGVMPFSSSVQLEPALTLKTRMGLVKDFQKGQTVGYSRTYTVSRPERLAVLPIGYSSGYPWSLSGKSEVLIRNRRHPIVGRISMDSMMVDIFDAPFKNGEEVILLGGPREYCISATELAQKASTIPYEILTRLSPNLPRLFLP
jgi:alanine racemase